jgi:hypothetical protein
MQQFIPFEDDWDALEQMHLEALIPYRVGLVPAHEPSRPGTADAAGQAPASGLASAPELPS